MVNDNVEWQMIEGLFVSVLCLIVWVFWFTLTNSACLASICALSTGGGFMIPSLVKRLRGKQ